MKKGFLIGTITLLMILALSYFTANWSYIYYVSGVLGLVFVATSIGLLIDSLLLGDKATFFSTKATRKRGRQEEAKRFIAIAVPNLLAAFLYIIN